MAKDDLCNHSAVACLNQHELIRKYRCESCGGVMMCICDENFGRRFLSHQLHEGCEIDTQRRVPVTHGFVSGICSECRGLPADSAPAAAIRGRTSKIKRYYWRELYFTARSAQGDWDDQNVDAEEHERRVSHSEIESRSLADIKGLHSSTPKYVFTELSQATVIQRYSVVLDKLSAIYAPGGGKGAQILQDGKIISAETFAKGHYEKLGWSVLQIESVPFHALYGVMMWLLIQGPFDPLNRIVGFGDRGVYEATRQKPQIWTPLPEDFGTQGYFKRRTAAINEHFSLLVPDRKELLRVFDHWRPMSADLRQYLWAHRDEDVDRARQLIEVIPPETVITILRYLVGNYWARFLGWPDLLLHRTGEFEFVEVKSSSDRLSEDQKRWIADNHDLLHLPFRIAKIHRL
jgi:VRR-NUC domain